MTFIFSSFIIKIKILSSSLYALFALIFFRNLDLIPNQQELNDEEKEKKTINKTRWRWGEFNQKSIGLIYRCFQKPNNAVFSRRCSCLHKQDKMEMGESSIKKAVVSDIGSFKISIMLLLVVSVHVRRSLSPVFLFIFGSKFGRLDRSDREPVGRPVWVA